MVTKDMVLMPILQLVYSYIEGNKILIAVKKIECLKAHLTAAEVNQKNAAVTLILENVITCLNKFVEKRDEAEALFIKYIDEPEPCCECAACRDCRRLFWIKLYGSLYDVRRCKISERELIEQNNFVFSEIPPSLKQYLAADISATDYYLDRYRILKKERDIEDKLFILKGMSSSTPALLNGALDTDAYNGGGLYFKWKGTGVAIDPGYHFVEMLHLNDLTVLDIDVVIITHEHIDHTNDMRLLDDLHYSLFRYHIQPQKNNHKIHWYMDTVTYQLAKVLQDNRSGFDNSINVLTELKPQSQIAAGDGNKPDIETGIFLQKTDIGHSGEIKLELFETRHEKSESNCFSCHTFGCRFILTDKIQEKKFVYSSDTAYYPGLEKEFSGADIVIANISYINESDLMRIKCKENHLGYYGCYEILMGNIHKLPSMFLISEFWNSTGDIRFDVSKYLRDEIIKTDQRVEAEVQVLPAEAGMRIDLCMLAVRCSCCENYVRNPIVLRPEKTNGEIRYLCKNCFY